MSQLYMSMYVYIVLMMHVKITPMQYSMYLSISNDMFMHLKVTSFFQHSFILCTPLRNNTCVVVFLFSIGLKCYNHALNLFYTSHYTC